MQMANESRFVAWATPLSAFIALYLSWWPTLFMHEVGFYFRRNRLLHWPRFTGLPQAATTRQTPIPGPWVLAFPCTPLSMCCIFPRSCLFFFNSFPPDSHESTWHQTSGAFAPGSRDTPGFDRIVVSERRGHKCWMRPTMPTLSASQNISR